MGIEKHAAEFLVTARKQGVSFASTCTLGHQALMMKPLRLKKLLAQHEMRPENFDAVYPWNGASHYADGLFQFLGANEFTVMDYSDYEGATLIHDLNQPISEDYKNRFDAVIDGGTLEHVFQFPVALKSVMEMVRVGGRLIILTVSNNACGHGFYQFSPELFFRCFNEANGYEMERMITYEWESPDWYEVVDPDAIGARVTLINKDVTGLLVQARRTALIEPFQTPPLQSDYVARWDQDDPSADSQQGKDPLRQVMRKLPPLQQDLIRQGYGDLRRMKGKRRLYRESKLSNRRFYKPVPHA